jgi:ketosteroid isomerase-like protein
LLAEGGSLEQEVESTLHSVFEAGRRGDFTTLARLHAQDARFSKFSDTPPLRRLTADEAQMHEELAFASLSDFHYHIRDLKVDVLGDLAVATFYLDYGGVLVNNYTFEGRTLEVQNRATVVLERHDGKWRILHEHFSRLLDFEATAAKP